MDRIKAAQVYNRICELGSLSAAARALGMSRPMVSRYLEQMESWAGTRLIHRSTRKLTITAAGEATLLQTWELAALAERISEQEETRQPAGTLRISCAMFLANNLLMPLLPEFLSRYPRVRIDLHISNQAVNLVEEGIDLAIRVTNDLDPNIIARRLGRCESVLCASGDYLKRHGSPDTPAQLAHHNCLLYSNFARGQWHFQHKDNDQQWYDITVQGNLAANESALLMNAAEAGMGIALLPRLEADAALKAGRLQPTLPDFHPETLGIFGLYRSRQHQPAALPLLLEALKTALSESEENPG